MRLNGALDIQPGAIVSFVGAGGKTAALFRLACELVEQGFRVLTTTTTRFAQDELQHAPYCIALGDSDELPASLHDDLETHRHVLLYHHLTPDNKAQGVSAAWVDQHLAGLPFVDILLIEADGSRRLPIKAPLAHEPPVPASSTLVIPVVGLSALDQPLDDTHVYGVEIMQKALGCVPGEPITEAIIAGFVTHPELGLKNVPDRARVIPLLNQATEAFLPRARAIAGLALKSPRIARVLIGSVQDDNPILEAQRRVGAVILAAGQSKRMGQPKLLLPWGDSTIIRRTVEQIAAAGLAEIVVVAGEWADRIREQVADLPARVVVNPEYATGEMLSSLKVGLNALGGECDACLVALGDQPMLEFSVTWRVLDAYARGEGRIVAPSYQNQRGHPLLIDRAYWQAILDLPPGKAPRDVLRANEQAIAYVVVDTDSALVDIDTPEDYERARKKGG